MTRVVSSGTTSNGDVVLYDDTVWALSGASTIDSSYEAQPLTPPPSGATPVMPPPQASTPGVAIDNDQASLAMTLFVPLAGIFVIFIIIMILLFGGGGRPATITAAA
jgi:hypothetical protein